MSEISVRPGRDLPEVLPLFPLTGLLLLPGNWMPLNVFEPRYRNLVEDVTSGAAHIGMIQPVVPGDDNHVDPLDVDPDDPTLYAVGCAGRVERCEPQEDGRFHVLLKGVCRFRVAEELEPSRGYRRVRADYSAFAADIDEADLPLDPDPLLEALRRFASRQSLELDFTRLELLSGPALVNGLAVALPFSPGEKQALLEADHLDHRRELLLSLMGMAAAGPAPTSSPVVH